MRMRPSSKWIITTIYIVMWTLTSGHAWHNSCQDRMGQWPCSAFLGAVWPVYILSNVGIAVMDPNNRLPTIAWEK